MRLITFFGLLFSVLCSVTIAYRGLKSLSRYEGEHIWVQHRGAWPSTADCKSLVKHGPTTIIYNYGANITYAGADSLFSCLRQDAALDARESVQEIDVAFPLTGNPGFEHQPLLRLVDILPNLKTIRWPRSRAHHEGRKMLNDWGAIPRDKWSLVTPHKEPMPPFVECNSNIANIRIECNYNIYDNECETKFNILYETLANCPNIKALDLNITEGCNHWWWTRHNHHLRAFDWRGSTPLASQKHRFPSLESLKLSGYDFEAQSTYLSYMKLLKKAPSISFWKSTMDWSKLKTLDIDRPPQIFLDTFHGQLSSLESLTIRPRWDLGCCAFCEPGPPQNIPTTSRTAAIIRQNLTTFIAGLSPLQKLSVSGMGGRLLDLGPILKTHGRNLTSLTLHEHESDVNDRSLPNGIPQTLNVTQIRQLADNVPYLESLALDVARNNGRWPTATLEALSRFPAVRNLTLHFALENQTVVARDDWMTAVTTNDWGGVVWQSNSKPLKHLNPLLDETAARSMFHTLRQTNTGEVLKHVTIYAGQYGQPNPLLWQRSWQQRFWSPDPVRYECSVGADGGGYCEGGTEGWWRGAMKKDWAWQDWVNEEGYGSGLRSGGSIADWATTNQTPTYEKSAWQPMVAGCAESPVPTIWFG